MQCAINVAALLCVLPISNALVISQTPGSHPQSKPSVDSQAASIDVNRTLASRTSVNDSVTISLGHNTSLSDRKRTNVTGEADADSFYSCTGHDCTVDTAKMKADLNSGLVLFLGCSLDIFAIKYFCKSAQSKLIGFTNNFAYLAYCETGGFTLVYVFQPGASAPPYWKDYVGSLNSQQIVAQSARDIVRYFGREPTAVVVDASLWDVSNWWQKSGMPPEPYPVPSADLARWCHTDVPHLLQWVSACFPRSKIAFRTPPPVHAGNGYGQSPAIIAEMNRCVRDWGYDDLTRKVFANYHLIDYNRLVETFLMHQAPGPSMTFYKDVLHPGKQLSMEYVNAVLRWVRTLQHDPSFQKMGR